jgi:uncharacterized SAM-binding protein YcdF (DUF218 family)
VIQLFVETLKQFARPTSVVFLVAALAIGVFLSFRKRTQTKARWYFAGLLAFYWVVSAPVFVEPILRWQQGRYQVLTSAADARHARLIVVLGSGNATIQAAGQSLNFVTRTAALRLLEAARVYRLLGRPTVIVSGGVTARNVGALSEADAMRRAILELGVPAEQVMIEDQSKTTRDEAAVIARMLADRPKQPLVLVTSATHMSRALAVFRAVGLDPIPCAAPYASDHSFERGRWFPSDLALMMFDTLLYDAAASWYYRLRGWTAA